MEVSANNLLNCRDSPLLCQLNSGDGKGGSDRKVMSDMAVLREKKDDQLVLPTEDKTSSKAKNTPDDELEKRKRNVMKNILRLSTVAQAGTQTSVVMHRRALQRKRRKVQGLDLFDETPLMAEHELEKELEEEVESGSSMGSVYSSITAYLRALFLLPDARFNLRYLSNSYTESSSPGTPLPTTAELCQALNS